MIYFWIISDAGEKWKSTDPLLIPKQKWVNFTKKCKQVGIRNRFHIFLSSKFIELRSAGSEIGYFMLTDRSVKKQKHFAGG